MMAAVRGHGHHGIRRLDGLSTRMPLELIDRQPLRSGLTVLRYRPARPSGEHKAHGAGR